MNTYTLTNMLYYVDHLPHPVTNIDFTQSDTFKLIVEPTKTEFSVHKAILCERSPFFKACLQGDWLESHTNEVNLPEEFPDMIAIMIKWFYTNNLDPTFLPDATSADIALLYQMADHFLVFEFTNHIIDKFRAFCGVEHRIIKPDMLTALHEQDMTDTRLYAYCVDSLADQIRCSAADYGLGGCQYEELQAAYWNNDEIKIIVEARMAEDLARPECLDLVDCVPEMAGNFIGGYVIVAHASQLPFEGDVPNMCQNSSWRARQIQCTLGIDSTRVNKSCRSPAIEQKNINISKDGEQSTESDSEQKAKGAYEEKKDADAATDVADRGDRYGNSNPIEHEDAPVLGVKAIMLNKVLAEVLAMVVDWMYGLSISWSTLNASSPLSQRRGAMPLMPLMSLYYRAGSLEILVLQNQVMDAIRWWITRRGAHASLRVLKHVSGVRINQTPLHTFALKHFVHDLMALNARSLTWLEDCNDLSDEVVLLIGREIIRYQGQSYPDPALLKGCHFHIHENGGKYHLLEEISSTSTERLLEPGEEQDEGFSTSNQETAKTLSS